MIGRLTKRDKAILADLKRFRVMDRDSIAELHFAGLANPITATNTVMLRLVRQGHAKRSTVTSPYCYFDANMNVKPSSAKLPHWLAILDVYKDVRKYGKIEQFDVEPKLGAKGTVEPDIFMRFRKTPFFIEVQNAVYSERQMHQKFKRYESLYYSGKLSPFPRVLLISEHQYALDDYPFRVFQARSFTDFMRKVEVLKPKESSGIKVRIS
jgi:hypothetical protein